MEYLGFSFINEKIKNTFPPSNPKEEPFEPADSLRNTLLIQSSDKAIRS